ncbi:hypothetical protein Q7P37_009062 [Cladosporium fusiforme]
MVEGFALDGFNEEPQKISPRETGSSARFPKLVTLCERVARYALALVPLEPKRKRIRSRESQEIQVAQGDANDCRQQALQHTNHLAMQKVIQRSQAAKRQADRRLQEMIKHNEKGEGWSRRNEALRIRKFNHSLIKEAREARKEDWARGALAPRRDVGELSETYGSISLFNMNFAKVQEKNKLDWPGIVDGDRVVVIRGRDKGKIGKVDTVDEERGAVKVAGVNMGDVSVPEWAQQESSTESLISLELHIPLEDVRLVYPLPDKKTGVMQDTIIDRLVRVDEQWDDVKREWDQGQRAIPGTNTLIPWPEKVDPELKDHDDDTLRISVEEETFRPYLMNPPMPVSVIDELRNKYSKFRTRHDWEYVQKKEAEDARAEKRNDLIKTMRTPLQEMADMRAKQKAAAEKTLTDEQLAKIGEVMYNERVKAVQGLKQ